jgi:hypothetical protein
MKTLMTSKPLWCIAVLLLATATTAHAQSIYKCTQAGRVTYTDHPCPGHSGELLHQADDSEIIDQYLHLGQDDLAKRYAETHHIEALYQQRLAAHQLTLQAKAQRQADAAAAAQQRDDQAQRQALASNAANRDQLRVENEVLRQQNDQYRDQLTQPVYNAAPVYWGALPPRWNGHHDEHGHDHTPPPKPVFHPCTQLAGGRVQC